MGAKTPGRCLCGAVAFEAEGVGSVAVCHCGMCRRWGGGPFFAVDLRSEVTLIQQDELAWYESSSWARRGFCRACGTSLFYRLNDDPRLWVVNAGALDLPAGTALAHEIFIDEKPAYYALAGDHPRWTGAEFLAKLQEQGSG